MCVPDLALICEVMLMAEGFQRSRELARKFVGLYRLCEGMLSKARHYDWKLRAIKTTLSVAGAMRRASPPGVSEENVLLRALRDFNVGKLTGGDAPVFAGLLEDLFPGLPATVPRAADARFEAASAAAAVRLGYVPERRFLLKVSQLRELFTVRWSVFLLGPPGAGKTAVWRTLAAAQQALGEATDVAVLNPKAVTRDELYGCSHQATAEWKDGLLSRAFRDFVSDKTRQHQWLVLDGDIDPEWIESMNTVMDDNRVLTLASNERIPLAPPMRLLLEIDSMAHCSPATVSRGGVVFVNGDEGLGGSGGDGGGGGEESASSSSSSSSGGGVWKPALESWVSGLGDAELRAAMRGLVAKCVFFFLREKKRVESFFLPRSPSPSLPLLPLNLDPLPFLSQKTSGTSSPRSTTAAATTGPSSLSRPSTR